MPNDKISNNFYRVSIKALIINEDKILLIQEADGRWELPGGGLNYNETINQALKRELKEEFGATVNKVDKNPIYIWTQEREKKGLKYHCLFLGYRVQLKKFKFRESAEAINYGFFNKKEMDKINLHVNLLNFYKIFNQLDFKL